MNNTAQGFDWFKWQTFCKACRELPLDASVDQIVMHCRWIEDRRRKRLYK